MRTTLYIIKAVGGFRNYLRARRLADAAVAGQDGTVNKGSEKRLRASEDLMLALRRVIQRSVQKWIVHSFVQDAVKRLRAKQGR
jgi:hypothetical protein